MLERFKVPEKDRVYVLQDRVRAATEGILRHNRLAPDEAATSADVLIKNDLIDIDNIIVDAKIGSSGAGAGGTSGTQHAMRAGDIRT